MAAVLAFAYGLMATPALAATYSATGSLDTTDPIFARPSSTLGASGKSTYYDAFNFTVDTSGSYTFALSSVNFDTVLVLYSPTFNTGSSLSNIVAFNDDAAPPATDSGFTRSLNAGTNYTAVLTSYDSNKTGGYAFNLSGPGNILAALPTPEPASWAMMTLGIGVVGHAMRRRAKVRFA